MQLDKKGVYQLVLDEPELFEEKKRYDNTERKRQVLHKPTILAETYWGGESALARAIAQGQAWYKSGTNQMQVEWFEGSLDNNQGKTDTLGIKGQKALSDEQSLDTRNMLDGISFNEEEFGDYKLGGLGFDGGKPCGSGGPMALEDRQEDVHGSGVIPARVLDIAKRAQCLCNKLVKDADKLVSKLVGFDKVSPKVEQAIENLYEGIEDATKGDFAIGKALRVQKSSTGEPLCAKSLNAMLIDLGSKTETLNEFYEVGKMYMRELAAKSKPTA